MQWVIMNRCLFMRKNDKKMVSLNPEYGIEVTALSQLADKIKDDNPELYNILTILVASLLGEDEKKLLMYCNQYLEDKIQKGDLKSQITKMIKDFENKIDNDKSSPYDF